ncbi:hypothetical protein ACNKHU_15835 [Shigella flexneri]
MMKEIRRTIEVLQRRTKRYPVLIGEPGVGEDCHPLKVWRSVYQRRSPGRVERPPGTGAGYGRAGGGADMAVSLNNV